MTVRYELVRMTKAVVWEEAKGKLRALVAAAGQEPGLSNSVFDQLNEKVESFIKEIESEGLCE